MICPYSAIFHSPANRTFSADYRTCSPSVVRLLVAPSRARDRRVAVGGRRTFESAFHVRLHPAVAGLSNSAVHLVACRLGLCMDTKSKFVYSKR